MWACLVSGKVVVSREPIFLHFDFEDFENVITTGSSALLEKNQVANARGNVHDALTQEASSGASVVNTVTLKTFLFP